MTTALASTLDQESSSIETRAKEKAIPLASLCFRTAVTVAMIGFGLGIAMGMMHDFTLAPVHAHINLLGYVSFFLYGAFYALVPEASKGMLPRIHYGLALVGAALMIGGLAGMLTGNPSPIPITIFGAFTVYAGLLVFAWIVFRSRLESRIS